MKFFCKVSWYVSSEFDSYLVIIGAESMHTVHVYGNDGFLGSLAPLNFGRRDHACGYYVDDNEKEVISFYVSFTTNFTISIYNKSFFLSFL